MSFLSSNAQIFVYYKFLIELMSHHLFIELNHVICVGILEQKYNWRVQLPNWQEDYWNHLQLKTYVTYFSNGAISTM